MICNRFILLLAIFMIGCFANAQSTIEQNLKERCGSGVETHFSAKFIGTNTGGLAGWGDAFGNTLSRFRLAPARLNFAATTGRGAGIPGAGGGRVGINAEHIFRGEINRRGRAVGFHHRGALTGNSKVIRVEGTPNAHGVYRVDVSVNGVVKQNQSTFFPDSWNRAKVLREIRGAYNNSTRPRGNNYFEGVSPSGVRVGGYLDNGGNINTAFPIY